MSTASALWSGFFQCEEPILQQTLPRETKPSFIPSCDFFVCWCWSGLCCLLNTQHTHKSSRKKGMKRPSHWLTTDPWLSFEKPSNQIVLLEELARPQSCPGPPGVTEQFRGVNVHFSQLSCDVWWGKGKQRSTEVIWCTNINFWNSSMVWQRRLYRWMKLPNVTDNKCYC